MKKLLLACVLWSFAAPAFAQQPELVYGLENIKIAKVDSVERRPGVDWKSDTRVLVQPVDVSFSRSWSASDYGTLGLSSSEVARIRASLADILRSVFRDVLQQGGYTLASHPSEGVLAVKPDIVDLYVNAPDALAAGRSRSLVISAGEMRLALVISDSITGTVLARARDKKRGSDTGPRWANSAFNRSEAESAVRKSAVQFRDALDAARAAP